MLLTNIRLWSWSLFFLKSVLSSSEGERLVRWLADALVAQNDASAREEEPAPSIIP